MEGIVSSWIYINSLTGIGHWICSTPTEWHTYIIWSSSRQFKRSHEIFYLEIQRIVQDLPRKPLHWRPWPLKVADSNSPPRILFKCVIEPPHLWNSKYSLESAQNSWIGIKASEKKIWWMDDFLWFDALFNSISVISGQWEVDNERLCAMEPRVWLRSRLEHGWNSRPLDQ